MNGVTLGTGRATWLLSASMEVMVSTTVLPQLPAPPAAALLLTLPLLSALMAGSEGTPLPGTHPTGRVSFRCEAAASFLGATAAMDGTVPSLAAESLVSREVLAVPSATGADAVSTAGSTGTVGDTVSLSLLSPTGAATATAATVDFFPFFSCGNLMVSLCRMKAARIDLCTRRKESNHTTNNSQQICE